VEAGTEIAFANGDRRLAHAGVIGLFVAESVLVSVIRERGGRSRPGTWCRWSPGLRPNFSWKQEPTKFVDSFYYSRWQLPILDRYFDRKFHSALRVRRPIMVNT